MRPLPPKTTTRSWPMPVSVQGAMHVPVLMAWGGLGPTTKSVCSSELGGDSLPCAQDRLLAAPIPLTSITGLMPLCHLTPLRAGNGPRRVVRPVLLAGRRCPHEPPVGRIDAAPSVLLVSRSGYLAEGSRRNARSGRLCGSVSGGSTMRLDRGPGKPEATSYCVGELLFRKFCNRSSTRVTRLTRAVNCSFLGSRSCACFQTFMAASYRC
jgi:hypothetical protein